MALFWIRLRLLTRHLVRESIALRRRLPNSQILAHLFEPLRPEPANRQQIVHALEDAVGFAHLQDLVRRRRPNPQPCCSSSDVAVWGFTGLAGGFFFHAFSVEADPTAAKRKE